ncbi:MAG: 16S rRNA (uracil(1498)-N(3))-methyltransferase [Gemmatimonadales bacterium]
MIRLLAPGPLDRAGDPVRLDPAELRHLAVRRVAMDTEVELLDGVGTVVRGTMGPDGAVRVLERLSHPRPEPIVLLVGAGDRDRFTWMVEKAQELGVTEIVPVETERSKSVETRLRIGQLDKLRARAREALKQCGAAWALELRDLCPLEQALGAVEADSRWLADPAGGAIAARPAGAAAAVLIGPEGGLTEPERRLALDAGHLPLWLGPNTLRFETAAIAAAALLVTSRSRPQ